MKNEKISVIVPIYNVEKYLKTCIESIINQTYSNIEIILVDDGSPDNCGKICDDYKEKDKRIKVIHKKNGGLSDARNAGIDIATGEYVVFIDSDDYVAENYIEVLYKMCIDQNVLLAECDYKNVEKDNEIAINQDDKIDIYSGIEMCERIYSDEVIRTVVVWNKMYKREIFNNLRFPKGKINEDEFTTYKIFYNLNQIAITNQKLYYYRYSPNSIMNKKFNKKRLDLIEAIEERLDFFKEKNEKELYDLTLKKYANILIKYYKLCKKYIDDSNCCKLIIKKFREKYKDIIKLENINIKSRIKYCIFFYFPILLLLK